MTHRALFFILEQTIKKKKNITQTLFVFLGEQTIHSFTIRHILQLVLPPQGQTTPWALN